MAFDTFTPPVLPSPGTPSNPQISITAAEFGDGYVQSSPRGINHIKDRLKLKWEGLLEADMITIRTFFEVHGGHEPFWYQPRGRSAPMKWICKTWTISDKSPWHITAEFEQSFVPEA